MPYTELTVDLSPTGNINADGGESDASSGWPPDTHGVNPNGNFQVEYNLDGTAYQIFTVPLGADKVKVSFNASYRNTCFFPPEGVHPVPGNHSFVSSIGTLIVELAGVQILSRSFAATNENDNEEVGEIEYVVDLPPGGLLDMSVELVFRFNLLVNVSNAHTTFGFPLIGSAAIRAYAIHFYYGSDEVAACDCCCCSDTGDL